jgi:hypothetical protein
MWLTRREPPPRADAAAADPRTTDLAAEQDGERGFRRSAGLLSATAINMTQMVGIGPFITIPLIIVAMGGPQGARRRSQPRSAPICCATSGAARARRS